MIRPCFIAVLLLLAACTSQPRPGPRDFEQWLAASPDRAPAFARFQALLAREGVADVVPARDLWLTDQSRRECAVEPFLLPPEEQWSNIVPALRYIRDYVEPAIGEVTVVSGYRDRAFNDCVGGAPHSVHRRFQALDLLPSGGNMTRDRLIEILCSIHAREGRRWNIGMGIYRARRFHIDAARYRGWGDDYHAASFPCAQR